MGKGRPGRYSGPRSINLLNQAGVLRKRYPDAKVILTRHRLIWLGELTPSEFSDTYEVLVDHNSWQQPLVYVVRPRLQKVDGHDLPHVFPWNTLCLHTQPQDGIASQLLADTVLPWTSEWLFFYEMWLASGGEWKGGGTHPTGGGGNLGATDRGHQTQRNRDRLERLMTALIHVHGTGLDMEGSVENAKL